MTAPGPAARTRLLGACGALAVASFALGDTLGALTRPGYSMWSQAISELVERGAPSKALVDPFLATYHALVIPFAIGLHRAIGDAARPRAGPVLLAAAGAAGVTLTLFFPCDPGCAPFVSLPGTLHIFIAIPMGLSILAAIWLVAARMARSARWRTCALYSRATAVLGAGLAATTVALAETGPVGVLERLLTYGYLQWYLVVSLRILRQGEGASGAA